MNIDMDSLECDLAETYHIYDYKELPVIKVALFSVGLRENSRIKMKMRNVDYSFETFILAGILDRLSLMVWQNTKDAVDGKNKPASILSCLMNIEENYQDKDLIIFNSSENFEKMRNQILEKGG